MTTGFSLYGWLIGLGQGVLRWLFGWWTVVFIGAQVAVLAFSPSSYGVEARGAVLRQIYHAAGPGLPGFTTLMALFNVVLIRILVVTALAYGLMLAWAALVAWAVWTRHLPLWTVAALAGVNLATLWLYAADKNAARQGQWRIAEKQLHLLALLGGWPAAWLAQQNMRHKSRKTAFRAIYWATIVLHCAALAGFLHWVGAFQPWL